MQYSGNPCGDTPRKGFLADAKAEFGPAQLALAAGYDRLAVAQWLVGKGVYVNAPGVMGTTRCGTSTQRYLAQEGGTPRICNDESCEYYKKVKGQDPQGARGTRESLRELPSTDCGPEGCHPPLSTFLSIQYSWDICLARLLASFIRTVLVTRRNL